LSVDSDIDVEIDVEIDVDVDVDEERHQPTGSRLKSGASPSL
jgi:hypothetical protein